MIDLRRVTAEFHPLLFEGDAQAVGSAVIGWVESGLTARVVRGRKMRTLGHMFDEFAAALQFPLYFGENKDAFDECIAELENLEARVGYLVVITEPDQVLADVDDEVLGWFVGSLESAAGQWSQPIDLGEWWDRPAIPFHVVLVGREESLALAAQRWSATGAVLLDLEPGGLP